MWFSAALLDKLQSFESSDHFQAGGITHTNLPFQETRVVDPDPDWIRIQSGLWIRIRNPDPDPGGQK
jgi:hypothetical protein